MITYACLHFQVNEIPCVWAFRTDAFYEMTFLTRQVKGSTIFLDKYIFKNAKGWGRKKTGS